MPEKCLASKTKSDATTYELKWNESNKRFEYPFTDTNGVLGNFDFSIDGFSVSKSGNSMTVYTKSVNTTATLGSFKSTIGAVDTTSSCVFWLTGNSGDQEFVSEQPSANPISAYIKVKTENIGYGEITKTDESSGVKLAGAVYGIYSDSGCKNLVSKMTTDGNGYAKSGDLVAGTYYVKEITAPSFTKDYPFAKYYAKEMETPAGYVTNEEVIAFDVQYQGQDIKVAKYSSIFLNTPTTFEFSREDITSGAEVSGATLCVIDKDGNVIETWTSVSGKKHVIKKLVVGETYTLREEFAPYGYLRATDIQFTVGDTENIQSVVMKDEVPTGSIIINKDGEFVTDKTLIKGHWYDFIFNYFKKSLARVTFEVYAAEDIVSSDGLDTVYFEKDELVATIVTDDNGIASIE